MPWSGLTDEERTFLREYLESFRTILDEVEAYCEEHKVTIISNGPLLDLGAAYSKLAEALGLGNPLQRYFEGE